MKHNTGSMEGPGCPTSKFILISTIVVVLLLVSLGIIAIKNLGLIIRNETMTIQATKEEERTLTKIYGNKVTSIIQNFQSKWDSEETIKNPSVREDLAVTPFLSGDLLSTPSNDRLCDGDSCLITKSVEIQSVRVLEYHMDRFKAIACGTAVLVRVTPQGKIITSLPPYLFRNIYVFVKSGEKWKAAGFFNITVPQDALRDWNYLPEYLRRTIGDLPVDINNCQ